MTPHVLPALYALAGTVLGGLISAALQWQRNRHEIQKLREEYKTEFEAEARVKHLLEHKGYTDRSFAAIKNGLGGFEEDELRKILVRAGAVRVMYKNGEEKWYLLDREGDRIANFNQKRASEEVLI